MAKLTQARPGKDQVFICNEKLNFISFKSLLFNLITVSSKNLGVHFSNHGINVQLHCKRNLKNLQWAWVARVA